MIKKKNTLNFFHKINHFRKINNVIIESVAYVSSGFVMNKEFFYKFTVILYSGKL
jgi:hypothetical protein